MDPFSHFSGAIPANSPRPSGHRRAHSETFIRLPDEILLDSDPDFFLANIEFPSLSDDFPFHGGGSQISADSGRSDPQVSSAPGRPGVWESRTRSLSVDAAFFEGLEFQGMTMEKDKAAGVLLPRHRRGGSMDGSTSFPFEGECALVEDFSKKAVTEDKLTELALMDPKRAKRILANRQSAARSKERKIRYTSELEQKVQTLQTEATSLSAQVALLQRDTTSLTAENRELKLRLQAMEQQAQLTTALNEALRGEVRRLKMASGELPRADGNAALNSRRPLH